MAAGITTISRGAGRISQRLDRLSERKFSLLVSVPGLLLLALIVLPPILTVFGLSMFRIELAKDPNATFNFFDFTTLHGNNFFVRMPRDSEIMDAIPRTLILAAFTTAVTLPLALVTALVLNRGFRGVSLFFMAVLLPWAISNVVAGIFWRVIFDTHFGIVNGILVGFGIIHDPINWLQNTTQAVIIAIVAQAWRGVPLLAVLLLAALKTIPATLYRAAKMDGATTWEAFRHITLPAIRPTLMVVAILQVILGLQVFDLLYTLTNGGPGRSTYVLIYAIYDLVFQNLSFGYGSAVTVVLFLMIVAVSLLLLLLQVRRRPAPVVLDEEAEQAAAGARTSLRFAAAGERGELRRWAEAEQPRRHLIRVSPRIGRLLFGIGAGILLFYFVAPILWMVIASLQTDAALQNMPPHLSLANVWLDGYTRIIQSPEWQGSLVVSLLNAVFTTFFVIVLASPAAYALARFNLPGKRAILTVLIFVQMVPAIVMAIPVLKIFQILGLTDTVQALIIVNTAFWLPLITWLLRNFFEDVPISLERAARIDGCSRLGTLFRVTVPAARPGIAAAAILILIGTWNEFLFAVILGNHNAVTITRLVTVITAFPYKMNESPPPDLLAAGGIVAVIPCLLLVLVFHRRIITGLTEGLVKG